MIPDEWEEKWKHLLEIYGKSEAELVLDLIEDEVELMVSEQKGAYDRMEDAARYIHEKMGSWGLTQFPQSVA
jgi:hypothetical protein